MKKEVPIKLEEPVEDENLISREMHFGQQPEGQSINYESNHPDAAWTIYLGKLKDFPV